MPRLPVVSGSRTLKAVQRAGFVFDHQTGSHVTLRHPETGRRVVIPMHTRRDLKRGTLRAIIRDAGLSVEEFRRLLK